MRLFLILGVFLALNSCNNVETKKVSSEEILAEELKTFNWNDVDEYPTFASCDSAMGKISKKNCFQSTLRATLNTNLAKNNLVVSESIDDTVELKIHIDKKGQLTLQDISCRSETKEHLPELDSVLRRSFDYLPRIYPAIKRSQQVATEFKLPVIIKID